MKLLEEVDDIDKVDIMVVRDVNGRGAKALTCATASKVVKEAMTLMVKDVLCCVVLGCIVLDMDLL